LLDSFALADSFAVATAQSRSAVIMTGDPGFKNVEHLVDIEWLDG
jgi:precorrin-6B methylase 1